MTGDIEDGRKVGYHEHAAASGPRGQSQRRVKHTLVIKETAFILLPFHSQCTRLVLLLGPAE